MIIEKNKYGAWVISDIINDYWERRTYYYYTKKESIKMYKQEMKELRGKA